MSQPSLYRAILHPRTYGLQTYTDAQLRDQALKLDGAGVYRGPGEDPGYVLTVRVVPDGSRPSSASGARVTVWAVPRRVLAARFSVAEQAACSPTSPKALAPLARASFPALRCVTPTRCGWRHPQGEVFRSKGGSP